jgi:hypothetical protein
MKTGGSACLCGPPLSSPGSVKDLRTASIKIRRLVAVTARGLRLWLTVASDVLVTVPAGAVGVTDFREGSEEAFESSVCCQHPVRSRRGLAVSPSLLRHLLCHKVCSREESQHQLATNDFETAPEQVLHLVIAHSILGGNWA